MRARRQFVEQGIVFREAVRPRVADGNERIRRHHVPADRVEQGDLAAVSPATRQAAGALDEFAPVFGVLV